MPLWHPVSISGYHIREAGSTAAQELAFTLADGFTYIEGAVERGLDVDDFAPRLSFFFNAHIDFFEEIAKYRAARRIWAGELRDRFGAKAPRSCLMRFHSQTAGVSLTAQQPEVNIVRTAIEALAAVGGTQSLHTNSFDEALALPTEDAARIALRTQQVIAHETGVTSAADPLGGAYLVEHLTNELERQAYAYFARIDELGGVVGRSSGTSSRPRSRRRRSATSRRSSAASGSSWASTRSRPRRAPSPRSSVLTPGSSAARSSGCERCEPDETPPPRELRSPASGQAPPRNAAT
jgi:methylmalonyl-CoA mutase cobalamin-binding domain/chain